RLGDFPLVVLACPDSAIRLGGFGSLAMLRTRGQASRLRSPLLAGLRCLLGGDAYACPLPAGETLVGSTFTDGDDPAPDPADDESNLRRLGRMLGVAPTTLGACLAGAATGFRFAARDRMPLLGWAPDEDAAVARREALLRNAKLPLPRAG